jgi:hypothetical protein
VRPIVILVFSILSLTTTAFSSDTLFIRSIRTIDICSDNRSALIVLDVGPVTARDSLMLFDITLSYDPTVFRPGVLLKQNTIGSQLDFYGGPHMSLAIEREIRLAGFSINRNAIGSLPLTAFNGEIIGDYCENLALFSLAYEPEFNEEFKKNITIVAIDSIVTIRNQKIDPHLGCLFEEDLVDFSDHDSIRIALNIQGTKSIERYVTIRNELSKGASRILLTQTAENQVKIVSSSDNQIVLKIQPNEEVQQITIIVSKIAQDSVEGSVVAFMSTDTCACTIPSLQDTIKYQYAPNPSTTVDADEGVEVITINDGIITIQPLHEQLKSVEIVDVLGVTVWKMASTATPTIIATPNLHSGMYFVVVTTNTSMYARKIVKK